MVTWKSMTPSSEQMGFGLESGPNSLGFRIPFIEVTQCGVVWRDTMALRLRPVAIASLGEQGNVSEFLTPAIEDSHGTPQRMCLRSISTRIADEKGNFKSCSLAGMSQSQIFWRRLTKAKS
jgi:hypothetical protein